MPEVAGITSGKIEIFDELADHGFDAAAKFEPPLHNFFWARVGHVIAQGRLQIDAVFGQFHLFGLRKQAFVADAHAG
jgi:hypothetical protein